MGAYHCVGTTCVRWRVLLPSDVHAFLFPFYESRITKRKMSMRKIKNFNLFHSALFIAILSLVSMFMCVWMLFQYSLPMSLYQPILSISINPFYLYQPILSLSTHSISITLFSFSEFSLSLPPNRLFFCLQWRFVTLFSCDRAFIELYSCLICLRV